MSRRNLPFVLLCLVAAAVCVRLGFWQLGRRDERRQRNELVRARLDVPLTPFDALPRDTATLRFRRSELRGVYDYAHEIVLAGRSRNGSPGVHIVTPLRVAGRDTAVLVKRGWVYSPNAAAVDLARWRERDTVAVRGFVDVFPAPAPGSPRVERAGRVYRWLDQRLLERETAYPLAPAVLVAQGDTAGTGANQIPVRLEPPPLDEGSHWNYAVQWFAFAGIAIAGLVAFLTAERRKAAALGEGARIAARDEGKRRSHGS